MKKAVVTQNQHQISLGVHMLLCVMLCTSFRLSISGGVRVARPLMVIEEQKRLCFKKDPHAKHASRAVTNKKWTSALLGSTRKAGRGKSIKLRLLLLYSIQATYGIQMKCQGVLRKHQQCGQTSNISGNSARESQAFSRLSEWAQH